VEQHFVRDTARPKGDNAVMPWRRGWFRAIAAMIA